MLLLLANSFCKAQDSIVVLDTSMSASRDEIILSGNGIPQNIIDKIFQPFFTTKPTGEEPDWV
ncbi:MAG TPA: hypothetical protein VHB70_18380 [Parafilimonas sp.]|nr:hypothetical protein [Parafilimonas sp.]